MTCGRLSLVSGAGGIGTCLVYCANQTKVSEMLRDCARSMARAWIATLTLSLLPDSCASMRLPATPTEKRVAGITRRAAGCGLFVAALTSSQSSSAFDNAVPEMVRFKDEKKSGVDIPLYTPNNKRQLGLQDNGKLATCGDAPNCFSTSGDSRHLLEVWSPQAGDAMNELLSTLKAYPPGQSGACLTPGGSSSCIDGGGFQIVTSTPSYLYVQFESLKYVYRMPFQMPCPITNAACCRRRSVVRPRASQPSLLTWQAFIDDVEFAVDAKGSVQIRSSSRVGQLDFGVNAKRLNLISERLRAKGWNAPAISRQTHPGYYVSNRL